MRRLRSGIDETTSSLCETRVAGLAGEQRLCDHAERLAASREHRVGDGAHEPDLAAAIDEIDSARGHC